MIKGRNVAINQSFIKYLPRKQKAFPSLKVFANNTDAYLGIDCLCSCLLPVSFICLSNKQPSSPVCFMNSQLPMSQIHIHPKLLTSRCKFSAHRNSFFLSSPLEGKRDIVVTILVRCMCARPCVSGSVRACVRPDLSGS